MKTEQDILEIEKIAIELQTQDEYAVHQCTQCGKIMAIPHGHREGLSCPCPIAKPWKWIPTEGWLRHYRRLRQAWS